MCFDCSDSLLFVRKIPINRAWLIGVAQMEFNCTQISRDDFRSAIYQIRHTLSLVDNSRYTVYGISMAWHHHVRDYDLQDGFYK